MDIEPPGHNQQEVALIKTHVSGTYLTFGRHDLDLIRAIMSVRTKGNPVGPGRKQYSVIYGVSHNKPLFCVSIL